MARCNCGPSGCQCNIQQGTGISISGDGSTDDPFVITADDAVQLRGDVDPEGAVVGNPGDVYASTDTAATQGRTLWIKVTGTGNTGWSLVAGDTGWRDISATMVNGWDGVLVVRRTERVVEYRLMGGDDTAATLDDIAPVPTGFNLAAGTVTPVPATGLARSIAGVASRQFVADAATLSIPTAVAVAGSLTDWQGSIVGHATDVWPTVLPGSALV